MKELTPRKIVEQLDKYIIGQKEAKKSVAIALRNRYRRNQLPADFKEEVMPKNILMMGPTGVGKTEIARRLAKLAEAPFIKVEVTKFTEVGYVGRDVESMVRDLVQVAIRMVRKEKVEEVEDKAEKLAEDRILDKLLPMPNEKENNNPLETLFDNFGGHQPKEESKEDDEHIKRLKSRREKLREELKAGNLEDRMIEIEVKEDNSQMIEIFSGSGVEEMGVNFQDVLGGMFPSQKKERKATIEEAREILKQQEAQKLIDMDEVSSEAIERVENSGIVFLDEMDKIAGNNATSNPEVSREGVQRDILPIVEGSTVTTKYGPVKTDHIFFIAAGAFHVSKPTDLIPELQGRFPIRVELQSLTEDNFKAILTEPENALTKQYKALLSTEDLEIEFTEDAIEEIAGIAFQVNEETENIGARRLHTVLEKLLEDLSFEAPETSGDYCEIDVEYVKEKLDDIVKDKDLSKYIL